MNRKPVRIGIDIGGTNAKLGLVTIDGSVLHQANEPMYHDRSVEHLIDRLTLQLRDLLDWGNINGYVISGIGVSVCGIVNETGDRPDYINVHALDNYPLKEYLQNEFNLPVVLECDMNCATLGEYYFGKHKGTSRLMVTTIATGIGMGMIVDGKLVRTNVGTTGNPGHVIVDPAGPICIAGCHGCLESYCSAAAISHMAEITALSPHETQLRKVFSQKNKLTPKDVFEAAELGDEPSRMIWEEVGKWMGRGAATWAGIFGPEVLIVGGGIAKAGHWLLEPMEKEMRRCGEPYFTRQVKEVINSSLGENIAMLGAASLIHFPLRDD